MSEKEKKKRKLPLSREEYSVLVSSVCFTGVVLAVIGIVAYKVVRVIMRMM